MIQIRHCERGEAIQQSLPRAPSKASASFLKKRSKKRLLLGDLATPVQPPPGPKVFWFFFSKKNVFLPSLLEA
jgi:hypothetical protein